MATQEKIGPVEVPEHVDEALPSSPKDLTAEAAASGQGLDGYETLTPLQTVRAFKLNSLFCILAGLSSAMEGYQIGLVGSIIANAGFVDTFATRENAAGEKYLASSVLSTWGVVGGISQITGHLMTPFVTQMFGRKGAMYTLWAFIAAGTVVESITSDYRVWYLSKVLGGIGVGSMQVTITGYISDIAPVRVRGAFLTNYSLWWITGQFFAPVALQILNKQDPNDFRTAILSQWGHIGAMIIIYVFLPESPVWCVNRGKTELAKKSLGQIYRGVKDFDLEKAYSLLVLNLEHEKAVALEQRSVSWWAIFKGTDGKRTLISCWSLLAQQVVGLGVFFTYGTYFFQQAGMSDPFAITCITSGINIGASLAVIAIADVVGRRPLACFGTTTCLVMNLCVGILGVTPSVKASDYLLVLFSVIWNIGLIVQGAVAWGYISEISSARLRHYTAGFAAGIPTIVSLPIGNLVPFMLNANEWDWGLKTCWFFFGLGAPFVIAMWFLIPETKGRSVAELDELFERKIKPWRFHKTETLTSRMVAQEAENEK